jgi:hypothetical protein
VFDRCHALCDITRKHGRYLMRLGALSLVLLFAGVLVVPSFAVAASNCGEPWGKLQSADLALASPGLRGEAVLASANHCAAEKQLGAVANAHRRWPLGVAAREQRMGSRLAFHAISAVASERLLSRYYGSVVDSARANPAAAVARRGRVVGYLSNYRAVVREPQGLRIESSTAPLRVGRGHAQGPVDLTLRERNATLTPVRGFTPRQVRRCTQTWGTESRSARITITPPRTGRSSASTPKAGSNRTHERSSAPH